MFLELEYDKRKSEMEIVMNRWGDEKARQGKKLEAGGLIQFDGR